MSHCVVFQTLLAVPHPHPDGATLIGQSTVANALDVKLTAEGRHTYILDGDNVRHGLNNGLGFSSEDRKENVRRVAEVARLMVDLGIIVLVPVIRYALCASCHDLFLGRAVRRMDP